MTDVREEYKAQKGQRIAVYRPTAWHEVQVLTALYLAEGYQQEKHDRRKAETLLAERDAEIICIRKALQEIKDTQGRVCEEYEMCTHVGCMSSHCSWQIAEAALTAGKPAEKETDAAREARKFSEGDAVRRAIDGARFGTAEKKCTEQQPWGGGQCILAAGHTGSHIPHGGETAEKEEP